MNGCRGMTCPCDRWINCRNYTDIRARKWKHNHDKHIATINEWYGQNFRIRYECPEAFPNG